MCVSETTLHTYAQGPWDEEALLEARLVDLDMVEGY